MYRIGNGDVYRISTQHLGRLYTSSQVDFFVFWVSPQNAWYIVPIGALGRTTGIAVYPHRSCIRGKYEKYREAWHLLR